MPKAKRIDLMVKAGVMTKKQADQLLRELGAHHFAKAKGRGDDQTDTKIAGVMSQLDAHEAEHGQVDLTPRLHSGATAPGAEASDPPAPGGGAYRQRIRAFIRSLRATGAAVAPAAAAHGILDVGFAAMDAMQNTIARLRLAAYSPEVTVDIPRNACGFHEFWRAKELIAVGRDRTAQAFAAAGRHRTPRATAADPAARMKVLLENDQVKIYEIAYAPGAENIEVAASALRVVRGLEGGSLERAYADGRKETLAWKPGTVRRIEPGPAYITRNTGSTEVRLYVVQVK